MVSVIIAGDLQWEVDSPCGDTGPEGLKAGQWDRAVDLATAWVWALSGRRYGLVDITFRPEYTNPAAQSRCPDFGAFGGLAYLGVVPGPSRVASAKLFLPGPAQSVTQVLVNGSVVASGAYLLQRNQLVRIDGQMWPATQNTGLGSDQPGTFEIQYVRGLPVPEGGQFAVGRLACQIAAALCGDKCALPSNTQTVVKNGHTVSLDAAQLQKAFTTISDVDQWCRQVNPNGRSHQPTVWSPDIDPDRYPSPASA